MGTLLECPFNISTIVRLVVYANNNLAWQNEITPAPRL